MTIKPARAPAISEKSFLLLSLFLLVAAIAHFYPICYVLRMSIDQGLVPLGADILLRGKLLYRDLSTVVFPGSFFFLALWLKIFGETWLSAKTLLFLELLLTLAFILFSSRLVMKTWFAFLPAALFLILGAPPNGYNFPSWDALFCFMGFIYFLSKALQKQDKQKRLLVLAGIFAALSVLCFQPLAIASVPGILLSARLLQKKFALPERQSLFCLAAPSAVMFLALVSYLSLTGTVADFINSTFSEVVSNYGSVNGVPYGDCSFLSASLFAHESPNLGYTLVTSLVADSLWFPFEFVKDAAFLVLAALCLYALKSGGLRNAWQNALAHHGTVIIWTVTGYGYWLVELHRADINRLFWGSIILLMVLCYFAECALSAWPRYAPLLKALAAFTLITVLGQMAIWGLFYATKPTTTLNTRWGLVPTVDDYKIVEVIERLTSPYDKVLVYPYDTTVNFLSRTSFPAAYPWLQYHYSPPGHMQKALEQLKCGAVKYVVWDQFYGNQSFADLGFPNYQPLPPEKLVIEPYLLAHYDFVHQYGRFRLMRLKAN